MGKREDAWACVRAGRPPREIARANGVTLSTILQYLDAGIGQGALRRSEILFTIPSETREALDKIRANDPFADSRTIEVQ